MTLLLERASGGDALAKGEAFERVYAELRRLAGEFMRRERAGHTLHATELVNEASLRLLGQREPWVNRGHFFAMASLAMRRVLVDHARARTARRAVTLGAEPMAGGSGASGGLTAVDVLTLDELLCRLERLDERKARVVELRYFGGLTVERVAEVLEVARSTVASDWAFARAWLAVRLEEGDGDAG